MHNDFLSFFRLDGEEVIVKDDYMYSSKSRIPIIEGILRFTPDVSYSSGNFSRLREKHSTLQLDSKNGTNDRLETILKRTQWEKSFFRNKTVLECGCGAGPDTEILLSLGAKVLSVDLAGVDIAKRNIGDNSNVQFVQASILDLPFMKKSFDIVFCHRVLQHTPAPHETLKHILQFVKTDGAVFVHSYGPMQKQIYLWKYFLRPFTTKMSPTTLYRVINFYSKPAYFLTTLLNMTNFGYNVSNKLIPFFNHKKHPAFAGKPMSFFIEYGIHDTFDALSPKYDNPIDPDVMEQIANENLKQPFEVVRLPTLTFLRSIITPSHS
jgi:ubiquinone/menaquinone biosynthesis C-methylase UbiE